MNKFRIASFFGGVGGIDLGFEQTGKFESVYINEFDKNAQETIALNFPRIPLDKRDIHVVKVKEVPNMDLIVGGFPCQAFSIAGYRKGFEDERGDLFFEMFRQIKAHRPRAIFIENVKNMVGHDNGNTFKVIRETLTMNGYFIKWKVLNAKDYGDIPQNRERIYIVGFTSREAFDSFKFPSMIARKTILSDVINFEEKVPDEFYYEKGKQPFFEELEKAVNDENTIYQWRRQYVRENKSGVVPTLTANMGTGGHNVPIIKGKHGIRKLTPREVFNVQGFPSDFKMPEISRSQLYKQAGNSVVVPVIKRIAENISSALMDGNSSILANEEIANDKEVALLTIKSLSPFEGESFLVGKFDTVAEAQIVADKPVVSNEMYLKVIKRSSLQEFQMIEV